MPIAASSEAVRNSRQFFMANGVPLHVTTFIGQDVAARRTGDGNASAAAAAEPKAGDPVPMAYLVEQPPHSVVQSHYHQADQFQLVVAGGGHLGRHEIGPLTVHYTNAFNAYGPIKAGPSGVQYFTLRNAYDPGAQYLPAKKDALKAATRTFLQETAIVGQAGWGDLAGLDATRSDVVLAQTGGGMGAWRHRLPEGARVTGPDPATGGGQYWVVTSGRLLRADGGELPAISTVFVHPTDAAFEAVAGAPGLEVLVLQYPRRANG